MDLLMERTLTEKNIKRFIGKNIFVQQRDGTRVEGKLVAVKGGKVYLKPIRGSSKKPVQTSFFFFIGLWIVGLIAIGLLLWCACCGSRVWGNRGCSCGCRRRPYRARRPYKHYGRRGYRRRYA